VDGVDCLHGLELDDDLTLDEQIDAVAAVDPHELYTTPLYVTGRAFWRST